MVPELVAPGLFDLETDIPDEDYCARVLRAMCRAAVENYGLGGGLVINYARLPEAVEQTILPHFGLEIGAAEHTAMREAARRDAKQPQQNFIPDSAGKQREANGRLRALAQYHLSDVYDALEKLQHRQR